MSLAYTSVSCEASTWQQCHPCLICLHGSRDMLPSAHRSCKLQAQAHCCAAWVACSAAWSTWEARKAAQRSVLEAQARQKEAAFRAAMQVCDSCVSKQLFANTPRH
jgi:hypothetical protein